MILPTTASSPYRAASSTSGRRVDSARSSQAPAPRNFDNGSSADDVRLTVTAPGASSVASVTSYTIQRALISATIGSANSMNCRLGATAPQTSDSTGAPAGSTFATVGGVPVAGGKQGT